MREINLIQLVQIIAIAFPLKHRKLCSVRKGGWGMFHEICAFCIMGTSFRHFCQYLRQKRSDSAIRCYPLCIDHEAIRTWSRSPGNSAKNVLYLQPWSACFPESHSLVLRGGCTRCTRDFAEITERCRGMKNYDVRRDLMRSSNAERGSHGEDIITHSDSRSVENQDVSYGNLDQQTTSSISTLGFASSWVRS